MALRSKVTQGLNLPCHVTFPTVFTRGIINIMRVRYSPSFIYSSCGFVDPLPKEHGVKITHGCYLVSYCTANCNHHIGIGLEAVEAKNIDLCMQLLLLNHVIKISHHVQFGNSTGTSLV